MKSSRSQFHDIRGLRYHVRTWGEPHWPRLFLLHGWMDVSASFQFLVDSLKHDWYVIAPDWRGFGLTEWACGGGFSSSAVPGAARDRSQSSRIFG